MIEDPEDKEFEETTLEEMKKMVEKNKSKEQDEYYAYFHDGGLHGVYTKPTGMVVRFKNGNVLYPEAYDYEENKWVDSPRHDKIYWDVCDDAKCISEETAYKIIEMFKTK